jgi:hypothetical protein
MYCVEGLGSRVRVGWTWAWLQEKVVCIAEHELLVRGLVDCRDVDGLQGSDRGHGHETFGGRKMSRFCFVFA